MTKQIFPPWIWVKVWANAWAKVWVCFLALVLQSGLAYAEKGELPLAKDKNGSQVWIVQFTEPPVASFRGFPDDHPKSTLLKATSPEVTGAKRLDMASPDSIAYSDYLHGQQDAVLAQLSGGKSLPPIRHRYLAALNGVAMVLTQDQVATLSADPRVLSVTADRVSQLQTDAGPAWIRATELWDGQGGGITNMGEGVVIGILDSGINWSHPSFAAIGEDGYVHSNPFNGFLGSCNGGGATCTNKLVGVHDMTDEGSNGFDTNRHGTHVASIAAGNFVTAQIDGQTLSQPTDVQISGVAPHANIVSYKVCVDDGQSGSCSNSDMVAAIDQAIIDGVDVINMSIGGFPANGVTSASFSPWIDGTSMALLNARSAGIVPVIAAGNGGPLPGSVMSPGFSPWVITAANATHDRRFSNSLINLSGGDTPPPPDLQGVGITSGYGPAPILHADSVNNGQCGVGTDIDFPPSGASNPFGPQTFNGEIVVCDRGTYARVTKGFNVLQGGAGGFVLANTDEQSESIAADDHYLPGTHIGDSAGDLLRSWLSSGSGHTAQITGFSRDTSAQWGDVLNASSSRGPGQPVGLLKPDVAAPGTSIYGANLPSSDSPGNFAFLSGTSMASPHVAGAAALLVKARPQWDVARIESALVASAVVEDVRLEDAVTPAGPLARGGGRVDLIRASEARLWFPETQQNFNSANPSSGGDPASLNRPGMQSEDCRFGCSFTRMVRGSGSNSNWQVVIEAPDGAIVDVSPMSFSVGNQNPDQTLDISFDVSAAELIGTWVSGNVLLRFQGAGNVPDVRMPFAVFSTPPQLPRVELNSAQPNASQTASWVDVIPTDVLMLDGVGLSRAEKLNPVLGSDPTSLDPFNEDGGTFTVIVDVPEGSPLLVVEVLGSQAQDIDLYVGKDSGDGAANRGEMVCHSLGASNTEECLISNPAPGPWWILVQHFSNNSQPQRQVRMAFGAVDPQDDSLIATGPGIVTGDENSVPIEVDWHEGRMKSNERWYGAVRVGSRSDLAGNVGVIPVIVNKLPQTEFVQRPLFNGISEHASVGSGQIHDGLYIDVPPDASALTVSMSGSSGDVDLLLHQGQAPTDANDADFADQGSGSNHSISITPSDGLSAGRWYVAPFNVGAGERSVTIVVELETSAGAIDFVRSNWFNPSRDGHGADINRNANSIVVVWYTYLVDGTPVWYLATAPYDATVWSAPLLRVVWDGAFPYVSEVGRLGLTFRDRDDVQFSWHLLSGSGSEPFQPLISARDCIDDNGTPVNYSGHWFPPAESGYGSTIYTYADVEVHIHYLYDVLGVPRWVIGLNSPFGDDSVPLNQISGFCPDCPAVPTSAVPVGSATRSYSSPSNAVLDLDVSFSGSVPGDWQRSGVAIAPLSSPVSCQ